MFRIGKPPGRIFINYRRDDAAGVAGRLGDSLNRYFGDGRVFRDVEGIEAGANFEDVLHSTAQAADAMIVLIGRHWAGLADAQGRPRLHDPQDWVAREIDSALQRGIPVYPVLVESAQMPRADELPEALKPLARHNAMSISDHRWSADVTRLAKVVAIDLPGSAAERTLRAVQWLITLALFLSVSVTAALFTRNVMRPRPGALPLELWQSGVTFVVVLGSAMLLLLVVRLIDPPRRRWAYAAAATGVFCTLASFVSLARLDDADEPTAMFFASTLTAMAVLALMNLSGFKAR